MSFICQYKFKVFEAKQALKKYTIFFLKPKQYTSFHLKVFFRDVYGLG